MGELEETTALVTGASRGIGRAIAEGLAEEGARVAINYRSSEDAAREAVETIEADGGDAIAVRADVSDPGSVEAMVGDCETEFGSIDVLVNNAGLLTQSPLVEMELEQWRETIDTDLTGTFLVTRNVLPGMLESGSGKVINVASQLGIKGAEEMAHYSAAKGGVIAFTRALAREVGPEVQVNAIAPGPIETDMLDDITEEWREDKERELPLGRLGTVEEVVPTAVLLAGEGGDYYTGQTLSPDGGDAMH